jgi:hypothetical protein
LEGCREIFIRRETMTREENLRAGAKLLAAAYYFAKNGEEGKAITRCQIAINAIRAAGRQRLEEEAKRNANY